MLDILWCLFCQDPKIAGVYKIPFPPPPLGGERNQRPKRRGREGKKEREGEGKEKGEGKGKREKGKEKGKDRGKEKGREKGRGKKERKRKSKGKGEGYLQKKGNSGEGGKVWRGKRGTYIGREGDR